MRLFIISILFFSIVLRASGQAALLTKFPKVNVTIKLLSDNSSTSDSIKFLITISNDSLINKKLLFDKPFSKTYPWGTTVMLENNAGKSMLKISNIELISSQLYSEKELEKKKFYSILESGKSLSHVYYLKDISIFNTPDGKLPKGKYSLQINYYTNQSNKIYFTIF